MTTLNNTKTSGRHFYAVKLNKAGKEVPYAFTTMLTRNEWIAKNENTKPVTAFEVYQLLNKHNNEALIINRQNRVIKVPHSEIENEPKNGQRLIRS